MIELRLPYPVSCNRYWRSVAGRVLVSREARGMREEVAFIVLASRVAKQVGRLAVSIDLHPPDRRRRDVDNSIKSLLDSLKHAGLYEDDSQIDELHVRRCDVVAGGACVVKVSPVTKEPGR